MSGKQQDYIGQERRKERCGDCTFNAAKLAELEVRHEMVIQGLTQGNARVDKLTATLEETNRTLNKVCISLAEQRGAKKMGLLIASVIGSFGGFIGEICLDRFFHR